MNKDLNYYMKLPYKMEIVEDKSEGGYVISFPELNGCITCGETMEEALKNADEAKEAWLMTCLEDGVSINEPMESKDFSGQFKLRLPKSLHKSLSEHAKKEGLSMNQYCLYLLTRNDSLMY